MAKNNKRKKIKPRSALFPEPIAKALASFLEREYSAVLTLQ